MVPCLIVYPVRSKKEDRMPLFPSLLSFLLLSLIFSFPISTSSTLCKPDDLKALIAIDTHFGNPPALASWRVPGTSCCSWTGLECYANTTRIRFLTFIGLTLSGTLPPAIGDLTELQDLIINKIPTLTGPIPPSLAKLHKLVYLSLSRNSLSGPIPDVLSQLTILSFLDLSYNMLTGSIPPSLSKLQNVGAFVLDHNRLAGPIPATFGTFAKVQGPNIFLSHNKLSGPIPASLGEPGISILDLSRNHLTGDASFLFGSTKNTTQLHLASNRLSFDLTHVTFPLDLTVLDLKHNLIYGSIPAQINQVTGLGLRTFNVSYNRLCGQIPPGVVTAKFSQYAYFNNKCLCGAPVQPCKT